MTIAFHLCPDEDLVYESVTPHRTEAQIAEATKLGIQAIRKNLRSEYSSYELQYLVSLVVQMTLCFFSVSRSPWYDVGTIRERKGDLSADGEGRILSTHSGTGRDWPRENLQQSDGFGPRSVGQSKYESPGQHHSATRLRLNNNFTRTLSSPTETR